MPVEAIHLSAFADSLAPSGAGLRYARDGDRPGNELAELARLGALLVDLPYFERFPTGVMRYLLHRPTAVARWGDVFHLAKPVGVGEAMLRRSATLRARDKRLAERLLALALGYFSHLAVDGSLHPLVNQMASARAARLGDAQLRQHSEVEKFQTVLFHEERLGFDFMGRRELAGHIGVNGSLLLRDAALLEQLNASIVDALGEAPGAAAWALWLRGYAQYVWLVSGPFGKTVVPERVKHSVRDEVYDGAWGTFVGAYEGAVMRSRDFIAAALSYVEAADDPVTLFAKVPEGPIDQQPAGGALYARD